MLTFGSRRVLIIGAVLVGLGNASLGFLDKVYNGNVFFGLSIVMRIVTAIGKLLNPITSQLLVINLNIMGRTR